MLTFEECGEMLDDIVDQMPPELFRDLNGGVILLPESKLHPCAVSKDLFILGEYRRDNLGKYIAIFYGSVSRIYGHLSKEQIEYHLTKIMHHEVRHHNEYLAGTDDLGLYDKKQIAEYLQKKEEQKNKSQNS